ncbi:MAG: HPr-rel-A system PqqD family peptide chaperone [Actinomycetota bacterium]|nr:HPr-rel-A system PqqD family peptide chaperone [Actinomycetota bacterium]MDA8358194.1 HPr-rel-A system PqqD family peptide chaperone [Actinomycetota bacterium]
MSDGKPAKVEPLEVNEAEDGLVVYDPTSGMVHHLNPTASVIFDLSNSTRDPETIARTLAEVFDLDSPPLGDVTAGLRDLAERGLVRWDPR